MHGDERQASELIGVRGGPGFETRDSEAHRRPRCAVRIHGKGQACRRGFDSRQVRCVHRFDRHLQGRGFEKQGSCWLRPSPSSRQWVWECDTHDARGSIKCNSAQTAVQGLVRALGAHLLSRSVDSNDAPTASDDRLALLVTSVPACKRTDRTVSQHGSARGATRGTRPTRPDQDIDIFGGFGANWGLKRNGCRAILPLGTFPGLGQHGDCTAWAWSWGDGCRPPFPAARGVSLLAAMTGGSGLVAGPLLCCKYWAQGGGDAN